MLNRLIELILLIVCILPIYAMGQSLRYSQETSNKDMLSEFSYYKQHYNLNDVYSKLVNNTGNGYDNLYGVRNFRVVLHGVYYRGGANNAYNKYGKRNNQNPLPTKGLENLCEENFGIAIYYYTTNYKSAPHELTCRSIQNTDNKLEYLNYPALNSNNHILILELIYKRIQGLISGPLYGHCWNGWHASGLMAALSLKQFCDFTGQEALSYWIKNTDGNSKGYTKIKSIILNFKPISKFSIAEDIKQTICP